MLPRVSFGHRMSDNLAEAILDSLDCEVEIQWESGTNTSIAAFEIAGRSGVVTFSSIEPAPLTWSVAFDFQKPGPATPEVVALSEDIRLYGYLFRAVREFIEDRQPTTVVFASKDEGLSRIYPAHLRREGRLPGKMDHR